MALPLRHLFFIFIFFWGGASLPLDSSSTCYQKNQDLTPKWFSFIQLIQVVPATSFYLLPENKNLTPKWFSFIQLIQVVPDTSFYLLPEYQDLTPKWFSFFQLIQVVPATSCYLLPEYQDLLPFRFRLGGFLFSRIRIINLFSSSFQRDLDQTMDT